MAGENRYIAGKPKITKVPIRGQTVVNPGDFMFLHQSWGGLIVGRAVDYYGYPFADASASCKTYIVQHYLHSDFLGVAMNGSVSGVTENLAVATAGQFRYPFESGVTYTSNVTAGLKVSMASYPENQTVRPHSTSRGSTAAIGYITKTESGTSFVDFFIRTALGPVNSI